MRASSCQQAYTSMKTDRRGYGQRLRTVYPGAHVVRCRAGLQTRRVPALKSRPTAEDKRSRLDALEAMNTVSTSAARFVSHDERRGGFLPRRRTRNSLGDYSRRMRADA